MTCLLQRWIKVYSILCYSKITYEIKGWPMKDAGSVSDGMPEEVALQEKNGEFDQQ